MPNPRQADYTFRWKNRQMVMHEIVINLHMHTLYSDGHVTHSQIAQAALRAGLDAVIITDHNVWVSGLDDYYIEGNRRVLLMIGEEIHDQARAPQKNHLLVFGAGRELATYAYHPQTLLDSVARAGGVAFIAHPVDPESPSINETDISWVDWEVQGYTGIELWNGLSEFKGRIKSRLHAIFYAYNPHLVAQAPYPETLQRWDQLLVQGRRVAAIGGSDAHAIPAKMGPLRRTIFPHEFHFKAINTHLLIPEPLQGDVHQDSQAILDAMRQGHAFVGYDLPASTRGFRFTAHGKEHTAWMGDEISAENGLTFQVRLPQRTECALIKDGKTIKIWKNKDSCTHITTEPGVYRLEAYIQYYGHRRGWIYSNPIYVRP